MGGGKERLVEIAGKLQSYPDHAFSKGKGQKSRSERSFVITICV